LARPEYNRARRTLCFPPLLGSIFLVRRHWLVRIARRIPTPFQAVSTPSIVSVDQFEGPSTFVCPSCGAVSTGQFCTACGERKMGSEDRSLRHYLDIVIDFLTHFDSKGYRTLRYLVAKPGLLSVEQLRGSRVRYAKPLSLFI